MGTPPRSPDPCRTPGAKYGTDMTTNSVTLTIELPLDVFSGLGTAGERQLEADLHVAVLRVMETVYRDRWSQFRGKMLDGDVMPEHWYQL